MPVQTVRGEPGELVGEWVGQFASEAQTQNLQLTYQHTLVGMYWFDLDKLERIVYNLLSNAVKFTPPGGRIRVELNPAPMEGILLTIEDSGRGIPTEALPHIFERFYQVSPDRIVRPPGWIDWMDDSPINYHLQTDTGIGLALVYDLIRIQSGTITVQSELDRSPPRRVRFWRRTIGHESRYQPQLPVP